MKIEKVFRNKPSPHYEDWIILDNDEIPTLQGIQEFKQERKNKIEKNENK